MTPNYDDLSVEDLNSILEDRNLSAEVYRDETIRIRKVRDAKAVKESAAAKLAEMSDEERAVLTQLIAPAGFVAGEASGEAGS